MASALTKDNSFDKNFASGEKDTIMTALGKELLADFGATTNDQIKCVQSFVSQRTGIAFGAWKCLLKMIAQLYEKQ